MPCWSGLLSCGSHRTAPTLLRTTLRRARWATRVQFLNLGFIAGVWGVHVPSIKAHFALDERLLSFVLLSMSTGSLVSLLLAGRVIAKLGARDASVVTGVLFCSGLGLSLLAPGVVTLCLALGCMGAGESMYDVAINTEGTTLETMSGRAVMSGFHGMFSLGAMGGAGASAAMLRLGIVPTTQLISVAIVIMAVVTIASRGMLEVHPPAESAQLHFTWPRGVLLVIGILILCGMLAEGVMYNWSVLYVQQELHTPQERAALAYVAFAGATAAMRFVGDAVRARVSERVMLLMGTLLSAVAMAIVLLVARPWVAMVGFGLVGVGLATVVPILYNAATRVPGVSRAAAIASVSSIGYLGFMIGPPIIGAIAHATTLTTAMATLSVAAIILALGTPRVPTSPALSRPRGTAPAASG